MFEIDGSSVLNQSFPPIVPVLGSEQAILLTDSDIDNHSAVSPSALSHTLFVHMNYRWDRSYFIVPFVGAGSEVTVDGGSAKQRSALSEWAVWLKGGISY